MTQFDTEWQKLFNHLPAPCLAVDRDLLIIGASDLYLATVQRTRDSIMGQYVFDAFPEEGDRLSLLEDAFRRAVAGEANSLTEVPYAIPVVDEAGQPTGKRKDIWWTCQHNPVFAEDGTVEYMVQNAQDVTRQVMAERLKDTVVQELQHRVGNIFALIGSTVKRTIATSTDFDDFLDKFEGRLMALSRTHRYLTGENWDGITLDAIVARELAEYDELSSDKVKVSGSEIVVNAVEAQILTLAVHELATNSVKYGALKFPEGRLTINWNPSGNEGYDFEWREEGIAIDVTPERKGFGSFILDTVIPAQLQGTANRDFRPTEFIYQLSVPERV